jgi:anti-sigma B factor antagonist
VAPATSSCLCERSLANANHSLTFVWLASVLVGPNELRAIDLRLRTACVEAGVYVIQVEGELDLYSSPELMRTVERLADDARSLVVDLSRTTFIDSTGVGILIAATKLMRLRGDELHLAGASPLTSRTLKTAGLQTFFSLVPTVAEAVTRAPR